MKTNNYKRPTSKDQLLFLQNIQRILSEGSFSSTYKFALLHVLADLSVAYGDDSGAPLDLLVSDISEQFLELYKKQTLNYPGTDDQILRQNSDPQKQAAIVSRISEARVAYMGQVHHADLESQLIRKIGSIVRQMPLWKLQTVGHETINFLYDKPNANPIHTITLKPGIAYCFRQFYSFITNMVQGAWVEQVRKFNADILGETVDLRAFLFGTQRNSLERIKHVLYEIQEGRCFYTGRNLNLSEVEVDHFIPWSRYPIDLGHNFVLTSGPTNRSKSNYIAAEQYLCKWTEFCLKNQSDLAEQFDREKIQYDLESSLKVAQWCYRQVDQVQGQVWIKRGELETLSDLWKPILDQAIQTVQSTEN